MPKSADFLFLDVETTSLNGSICSIAWESDDASESFYSLINPGDAKFDPRSVSVHHIRPDDVVSAPKFVDVWPRLEKDFKKKVIVGYNVAYDIRAVWRELDAAGLETPPVCYIDVYRATKRTLGVRSCPLDAVCEHFGIQFEHHNAASDVSATRQVFARLPGEELIARPYRFEDVGVSSYCYEPVEREKHDFEAPDLDDGVPVVFSDNNFVVTGEFREPRSSVEAKIQALGGSVKRAVSKKVDFLVVGNPADAWKSEKGGQKLLDALKIREAGGKVKIISEQAFYSALEN